MQMYCCLRRDPQPLCSRLKLIAALLSVAEYTLTGMETSPKLIDSEAMERAAIATSSREWNRSSSSQCSSQGAWRQRSAPTCGVRHVLQRGHQPITEVIQPVS